MKAKYPLLLLLVALALAGCNSKPPGDGPTENGTVSMNLFKEGKGVWFSDVTKTLFGLEIAEAASEFLKGETSATLGQGLLNTYCRFDNSGEIDSIAFHGRTVHELENDALRHMECRSVYLGGPAMGNRWATDG